MEQVYVLSQVPIQTHEPYVSYFLSLDSPPLSMEKWWIILQMHLYPFCELTEETFI